MPSFSLYAFSLTIVFFFLFISLKYVSFYLVLLYIYSIIITVMINLYTTSYRLRAKSTSHPSTNQAEPAVGFPQVGPPRNYLLAFVLIVPVSSSILPVHHRQILHRTARAQPVNVGVAAAVAPIAITVGMMVVAIRRPTAIRVRVVVVLLVEPGRHHRQRRRGRGRIVVVVAGRRRGRREADVVDRHGALVHARAPRVRGAARRLLDAGRVD